MKTITKRQAIYNSLKKIKAFQSYNRTERAAIVNAVLSGRKVLTTSTNGTPDTAGLQFTMNHTGKMKGLISLSSSVLDNPICQKRVNDPESICAYCFSVSMQKQYSNLQRMLTRNTVAIADHILTDEETPIILSRTKMFRVEPFGDVSNMVQAANYLNICRLNPWNSCAIWTKNPSFYHAAIQSGHADKGSNTQVIFSSYKLNTVSAIPTKYEYLFDKVFTVYKDTKTASTKDVIINCGARSCATCKRCYTQCDTRPELVNELVK